MESKNLSFKIGLTLALIHLCLVSYIISIFLSSGQSSIGLLGILWVLDCPLIPFSMLALVITQNNTIACITVLVIIHALIGTIFWFFLPIMVAKIRKKL